jgi:hypothetical protein
MVQRLAEDKRRLIMQLDRWLTEAGRGQTEAHHAAGSLIDRGWRRTNGGSSCSWIADWQRLAEDKRRLIMQLDRWLTEDGRGQTEAHHAARSLIGRWSAYVKHQSSVFMAISLYGLWGKWNQYLVRMPKKFVPVPRRKHAHTWDFLNGKQKAKSELNWSY